VGAVRSRRAAASPARAAIALAALGASLLIPSTAGAASVRSEFYGVVQTAATLDNKDLASLKATHVHTVRYLFQWESIQPKNGSTFRWGPSDKFVGRLAHYGIRAVPTVWGNPKWVGRPKDTSRPPIGSLKDKQAWQSFLKAVTGRYGPNGYYWRNGYRQDYGANAVPLPIQAYQIWNEPNLKKYFIPYPAPKEYAQLLQLSSTAIKSVDPKAQIVLGGMPGNGDVKASVFLDSLYKQIKVPKVQRYFDAAALHPYSAKLSQVQGQIAQFRQVMKKHHDAATPLWISEIAWGSARPDSRGINKGPAGQAKMLKDAYNLMLNHRAAWKIKNIFWYHWRDPKRSRASCTFCSSAALLNFNRTKKPAFTAFKSFAADVTAPKARITAGPAQNSVTQDSTPSFSFRSNQAGSTFQCRFDSRPQVSCASPYTAKPPLTNGAHVFSVKAIDPAGNLSLTVSRSFTVAP
jgi:polysaccharide biosynthesis protein PslG